MLKKRLSVAAAKVLLLTLNVMASDTNIGNLLIKHPFFMGYNVMTEAGWSD